MSSAVRIHPENRKIFEFRGKPIKLVTATKQRLVLPAFQHDIVLHIHKRDSLS